MYPPSHGLDLDIEAISGVLGSISIACWVVVFSPQVIENFRRKSAEGLSIEFIIIWLLGDVFNIIGGVLQKILPTMLILAIYYTFADIVLLGQCFYYRGFSFRDPRPDKQPATAIDETTSLLHPNGHTNSRSNGHPTGETGSRRASFRHRLTSFDTHHLSPATPLHPISSSAIDDTDPTASPSTSQRTWLQAILFNSTAVLLVILAGAAGFYLSSTPTSSPSPTLDPPSLHLDLWGQISGYTCAILYLGSRVPQLLLNYRRKSTEGLNALFFLFACLGNLTYVLSIFAYEPSCVSRGRLHHGRRRHHHGSGGSCKPGEALDEYERYILVNLSWLIGSLGTLFLDFAVFVQFWMYTNNVVEDGKTVSAVERGQDDGERE